jgi:hypothetical protein
MKAETRTAIGRNQLRALRAKGWTPAVVYGEKKDPLSISISEWELEQHIKKHHKVFRLEIDGKARGGAHAASRAASRASARSTRSGVELAAPQPLRHKQSSGGGGSGSGSGGGGAPPSPCSARGLTDSELVW